MHPAASATSFGIKIALLLYYKQNFGNNTFAGPMGIVAKYLAAE